MPSIFNVLLDSLNQGVMLVDKNCQIVIWNRWLEKVSGLTKAEIIGKCVFKVCPRFAEPKFRKILTDAIVNSQYRFCAGALHQAFVLSSSEEKFQNTKRQNMQIEPLYYQGEVFALIQINDITVQSRRVFCLQSLIKELETDFQDLKKVEESALQDPLTGLGNRQLLFNHLKNVMIKFSQENQQVAIFFIDLDEFKTINDSYGHFIGDDLLKEVAIRLKQIVRQNDIVTRFGGDEFIVVMQNIPTPVEAKVVARKIQKSFDKEFNLNGVKVNITASIGISLFPSDDDDLIDLLKKADSAMYSAKKFGKNNYQFYEESEL